MTIDDLKEKVAALESKLNTLRIMCSGTAVITFITDSGETAILEIGKCENSRYSYMAPHTDIQAAVRAIVHHEISDLEAKFRMMGFDFLDATLVAENIRFYEAPKTVDEDPDEDPDENATHEEVF